MVLNSSPGGLESRLKKYLVKQAVEAYSGSTWKEPINEPYKSIEQGLSEPFLSVLLLKVLKLR